MGGLISILLVPISIGVLGDYIPIFGSRNPGMFDKFFALLLSVSFSLGYAIFLATARKYYIGEITRVSIKNLLWGVTAGAFVKMMIAFILFHFIYLKVLQPETLSALLNRLQPMIKYDTLNYIYGWLLNFKPVFLTSAYFIVFVSLLYIAIPWTSVLFASRKIRRQIAQEEKWK